ncbi:MAG: hypothetical protein H8K03_20775 [Nitrospira sp.]|jgi:hypothetical protein|nr:hypothetical protein [Nitrospira sp. BO4]
MSVKSMMLTVGFLSMAATAMADTSNSLTTDTRRVDVIDTHKELVTQLDSNKGGGHEARVDVIGSIESKGPVYPYIAPMNR